MEVLTVGQILANVPGEFHGDESVKSKIVSGFCFNMPAGIHPRMKKDCVFVIRLETNNVEQFIKDNLDTILKNKVALVVAPTPPPIR